MNLGEKKGGCGTTRTLKIVFANRFVGKSQLNLNIKIHFDSIIPHRVMVLLAALLLYKPKRLVKLNPDSVLNIDMQRNFTSDGIFPFWSSINLERSTRPDPRLRTAPINARL